MQEREEFDFATRAFGVGRVAFGGGEMIGGAVEGVLSQGPGAERGAVDEEIGVAPDREVKWV